MFTKKLFELCDEMIKKLSKEEKKNLSDFVDSEFKKLEEKINSKTDNSK